MRTVTADLAGEITSGPAEIVLSVAVAAGPQITAEELSLTVDGEFVHHEEIVDDQGTRLHLARSLPAGQFEVRYRAEVSGRITPSPQTPLKRIEYLRPSRYADSDVLQPIAVAEFGQLSGADLMTGITDWVSRQLAYVSGSSRATDGAVDTLLARRGVCRDFAHLVIGLLRARGVPARLVSVYAPGLSPMDFHAVAEAYVEGAWYVLDATRLAPRSAMLRIATGRDAADTAFMTVLSGLVSMGPMEVSATISPDLPTDDPAQLVQLS